jgi:ATP-dependent metalloprotease FtsH
MDKKPDRHAFLEIPQLQDNKKTYRDTLIRFLKKHGRLLITSGLLFALFLLLCGIASQLPGPLANQPPENATPVSFGAFVREIKTGNIQTVTIQGSDMTAGLKHSLRGQLCATLPANETLEFSGTPERIDPTCAIYLDAPAHSFGTLLPLLLHTGVTVKTKAAPLSSFSFLNIFCQIALLMILLLCVSQFFLKRHASPSAGQYSRFLKSRARLVAGTSKRGPVQSEPVASSTSATTPARPAPPVTFADVAGIDEARAELEEIVKFLRCPEQFQRLGAHMPGGILLVGPPGTGKTLLAKAVAGEAGVPFFHASASEFVELFVGVGASRVRDLFLQARQSAPCVIFLDEIDAVGRKRALRPVDSGERDQTLNQLLIELDGFKGRSTVIVLAATNRLDMLDAALLRPGRFDRHVILSLPDRAGREAILRIHTRHTPLNAGVHLERLARLTIGMSGAELANLVNEAALCAARRNLPGLNQQCFEEALVRLQLGVQRSLVIGEKERRVIAFHECGHALVAFYLPEADLVNSITLLPRGQHIGATQFAPQEDRYNFSRATLMARIAVRLGGRVAVELACGPEEVTTRAEDDFQAATALAWRMVTHWGMGEQTGVVFADYDAVASPPGSSQRAGLRASISRGGSIPERNSPPARQLTSTFEQGFASMMSGLRSASSPFMATMIDEEVRRILKEGRKTACFVLSEHYNQLTCLANALMEREQLERQQIEAILRE